MHDASSRSRRPCLAALASFVAACSAEPTWVSIPEGDLTGPETAQRAAAERARDGLASTLLAELTAALASGPAQAIEVCRARAPAIAAAVATEHGVRIGRTSTALRNQHNVAPEWASAHVAAALPQPAWFRGPVQQLGVLYPIRLMPLCVQCHGVADDLAPAAREQLRVLYPDDRATGFAAGDLRGWFWVEVPKRP